MEGLYQTQRIKDLKDKMLSEPRYASIEQALIITKTYQEIEDEIVQLEFVMELYFQRVVAHG